MAPGVVMPSGGRYVRPPSLRDFLARGGDLGSFALLDSLVEAIVVARRLLPAEINRQQASHNRRFVERWFARHGDEEPVPATQELLTFALWKAECLEDPDLAGRFEASLPAVHLARALQVVEELRHCHPLGVQEELREWTCRACGEIFGRAPAVVVTNTGQELGYDADLTYCIGCMSIATTALETASGIDRFEEGIGDGRLRLRPDTTTADCARDGDEIVLLDEAGDAIFLGDEEALRREAARLGTQLDAARHHVATLEVRRASLVRHLESSRPGERPGGSSS